MYNTYEITSSAHSAEQLLDWFRSHGHMVTLVGPSSIVVRMDELKLEHVLRSPQLVGASSQLVSAYSQPIGLTRGEWVVMRSVGVAGRVANEHGNSKTPLTSANVTVGDATWSASRAIELVRVSELDEALAAKIIAIGEQQAAGWQGVMDDIATRQRLVNMLPAPAERPAPSMTPVAG